MPAVFGHNDEATVKRLKGPLKLTPRYQAFLVAADPLDVETVTPSERIRFVPAQGLVTEQPALEGGDGERTAPPGWKKSWVVIAHSALLGDPYFLDTSRPDAEGDCPVMTAMSGTDALRPILCASSFASFVRILATAMEVAADFAAGNFDEEDDAIFREAMSPKVKVIDAAALRAGHWT
ncbi:MAG: SMI1/KNR4 family protein [Myxococcales bacterium]|nr:SMI1/KNR4 family protein [Myxococcales bacterium]